MIIHALQTVLHLYKKYSEKVIVYAVIVHQANISCSSEVPYGRANSVIYISLLFLTPWIKLNEVIMYRVMMYANSLLIA